MRSAQRTQRQRTHEHYREICRTELARKPPQARPKEERRNWRERQRKSALHTAVQAELHARNLLGRIAKAAQARPKANLPAREWTAAELERVVRAKAKRERRAARRMREAERGGWGQL